MLPRSDHIYTSLSDPPATRHRCWIAVADTGRILNWYRYGIGQVTRHLLVAFADKTQCIARLFTKEQLQLTSAYRPL